MTAVACPLVNILGGSDTAHPGAAVLPARAAGKSYTPAPNLAPGSNAGGSFGRNVSPWTETAAANLALLWRDPAWSRQDIAGQMGKSISACERKAAHDGLGRRPPIRITRDIVPWRTDARKLLLATLYTTGVAIREIAEALNALPGQPVPNPTAAGLWASEAGFRRPHGYNGPGPKTRDRSREQKFAQAQRPGSTLIQRVCLRCNKGFGAENKFMRMCLYCRRENL